MPLNSLYKRPVTGSTPCHLLITDTDTFQWGVRPSLLLQDHLLTLEARRGWLSLLPPQRAGACLRTTHTRRHFTPRGWGVMFHCGGGGEAGTTQATSQKGRSRAMLGSWVLFGWVHGNPLFRGFGHQKRMFCLQDVESDSEADRGGYTSHILTNSITWPRAAFKGTRVTGEKEKKKMKRTPTRSPRC